jgi:flagellar basal body-associated protein FliL
MAEKDKKGKKDAEEKPAAEGAPEGAEGAKKDKGSNKLVLIIILLSIVAVQAVVVYFIIPKPENAEAKAAKLAEDSLRVAQEAATKMGALTDDMPIEATVNIAGTNGERYLKCAIILEYDEKNSALGAELRRRAPRYKDMLMDHMSSLTLIEVTEPKARDKIRKDLVRLINNTLPPKMGEINDVFFKDYIIQ